MMPSDPSFGISRPFPEAVDIDLELRRIHRWCNEQFVADNFAAVGVALAAIDVSATATDVLVGWLSATACARQQLGAARSQFSERARGPLTAAFGDQRVERIYSRIQ